MSGFAAWRQETIDFMLIPKTLRLFDVEISALLTYGN